MEASFLTRLAIAGLVAILPLYSSPSQGAEFRTRNFAVTATTPEIAQQVAETAEVCRRELALEWLGRELPNWFRPCPVKVTVGQIGAGGATTFTFDRGEVSGWNMRVQGTLERVLDSVIPHEVSHTIFASHFRRPLPRWADEGAATLIEHAEERKRQDVLLERVIKTSKRIPLERLLAMSEYPSEMQQVYTLYAEGYSLANYLVQQRGAEGKAVFLQFIQDAHRAGWKSAIQKHYEYGSISELEQEWTGWVLAGSPARRRAEGEAVATADSQPAAEQESIAVINRAVAMTSGNVSPSHLPPLPPLARAMRQPHGSADLREPVPAIGRTASASAGNPGDRRVASNGRVRPRIEAFPGEDPAAHSRLARIRQEMSVADQRAREISTGRTGAMNGDPVLRGQSPESRHWSEFSAFQRGRQSEENGGGPAWNAPFGG